MSLALDAFAGGAIGHFVMAPLGWCTFMMHCPHHWWKCWQTCNFMIILICSGIIKHPCIVLWGLQLLWLICHQSSSHKTGLLRFFPLHQHPICLPCISSFLPPHPMQSSGVIWDWHLLLKSLYVYFIPVLGIDKRQPTSWDKIFINS